jgi:hypothetical protein
MRRINGQFDDADQDYRVEKLVTVSGFVTTWEIEARNVSLKNAEQIRRRLLSCGIAARVIHQSEY